MVTINSTTSIDTSWIIKPMVVTMTFIYDVANATMVYYLIF